MNVFQVALLIGAAATALFAWDRRAMLWIAVGAFNFFVTTAYARHPQFAAIEPAFFTGLCDAATVALLLTFARYRWEMIVSGVFQAMILVSFLYLTPILDDHVTYVVTLEALNWLALMVIGGTRLMELADDGMERMGWGGLFGRAVHRVNLLAWSNRKSARIPFWSPLVKARWNRAS